jgi:hypothetical protein
LAESPDEDFKMRESQLKDFLNSWTNDAPAFSGSHFQEICRNYSPFLFSPQEITFDAPKATVKVTVEYVPITMRAIRCLILIVNPDLGEFFYEITASVKLPTPVAAPLDFKVITGEKQEKLLQLDPRNLALFQAIGYRRAKEENRGLFISDARQNDRINHHTHVILGAYMQSFSSTRFEVAQSTASFFDVPSSCSISKPGLLSPGSRGNTLPILFRPTKPGTYPCSITLLSEWDVRVFTFSGQATPATKTMSVELQTVSGHEVKQDIPFHNPSTVPWTFRTALHGDLGFSVAKDFVVSPGEIYQLRLLFVSGEVGQKSATLTVRNVTKEATLIFAISANVGDPPADRRIELKCIARRPFKHLIPVAGLFQNASIDVTSTVPIIDFPPKLVYRDGEPESPFEITVMCARSGISVGTITLTDPTTRAYAWFVVEIKVERPIPEEIIEVETVARKSATVNIPVNNPTSEHVTFDVDFERHDFFGDRRLEIAPLSTAVYSFVFSPLKAMTRTSYISFYNETAGEFVYQLNLQVCAPDLKTLAPLSASVGSVASVYIVLENPIDHSSTFKIENENPNSFQVMSGPVLTLGPVEQRRIGIRFTPCSIGTTESSTVSFRSRQVGDVYYRVSGTGKPPQPLSPVIVECMAQLTRGGSIVFKNPFHYQTKFETQLVCEEETVFRLLSRRALFTLAGYNEPHQIAFAFSPLELKQYHATILVSTLGIDREIVWTFPLIGNTLLGSEQMSALRGRVGNVLFHKMPLSLVGEREVFKPENYHLMIEYPPGYEWMESMITVMPLEVLDSPNLSLTMKFEPRRPVRATLAVIVENPLRQKWRFGFDVTIERGRISRVITIESSLHVASARRIKILEPIRRRCEFRAYFEPGSVPELSVTPASGILDISVSPDAEFPFDVVFRPVMYGKMMRGMLVVETDDIEFLFEVHGKMPDYLPPKIERSGMIDVSKPEGAAMRRSARRNFIRENIEGVKANPPKQKMKVVKVKHGDGPSPFVTQMGADSRRPARSGFIGSDEESS